MARLILPNLHPAIDLLSAEGLNVASKSTSEKLQPTPQKPLNIGMINLMPNPLDPERDIGRLLAQSPYPVNLHTFTEERPRPTTNTARLEHNNLFSRPIRAIKDTPLDGFYITGASAEKPHFTELSFWPELADALDHGQKYKIPMHGICLGAQAPLYHFHGIEKVFHDQKLSGVFKQTVLEPEHPLMAGMPTYSYQPVSRRGRSDENAILDNPNLEVLVYSTKTGASLVFDRVSGTLSDLNHSEYTKYALPAENARDIASNVPHTKTPEGVFVGDDPKNGILSNRWANVAQVKTDNWLHLAAGKIIVSHSYEESQATPFVAGASFG